MRFANLEDTFHLVLGGEIAKTSVGKYDTGAALTADRKHHVRRISRKNCVDGVYPLHCRNLTLTHEEIVGLSSRRQQRMSTPSDGVMLVDSRESMKRRCDCVDGQHMNDKHPVCPTGVCDRLLSGQRHTCNP